LHERRSGAAHAGLRPIEIPVIPARRISRFVVTWRSVALLVIGVAVACGFGSWLDRRYPVKTWLFFELLRIYLWEALLTFACASFGHFVLSKVLRIRARSLLEAAALSLPIGLIAFVWGMYAGGFSRLYGSVFAVALPLVLLAVGLPEGARVLRGYVRWPGPPRGVALVTAAYGLVCLALLYVELLSPDALNYDATWNHLVISQDYAREGGIFPFLADWNKNVPHLTSIVNTWGFIVPGGGPVDDPRRWMMALHTEFTIFLWTLIGVSAATEWLAGHAARSAWVAFFLFPSIFVYDGNIGGSADHVLALFALPAFLASVRAANRFEPGPAALAGICAAGGMMTKFQSVYFIAPLGLFLAMRWMALAITRLRKGGEALGAPTMSHLGRGAAILIGCWVVVACPHYVKNWVYFRNPFYPLLQSIFTHSTPAPPDAPRLVRYLLTDWHTHPPRDLIQRFEQAARLVFTFSFEPHYSFIGDRPNFGSLFTLLLPFVPILPAARRLWFGYLVGIGSLAGWTLGFLVDRNLQAILPILVAVTAAVVVRVWRVGGLARLGLAPLVVLQVVWGADFMLSGNDRLQAGVALIKSGFDARASERFAGYRRGYRDVGHSLPRDALVVLHESHVSLGINRRILLDLAGFQGLIDYRVFRSPRDMYDRFAELGVTHLLVPAGSHTASSKQEDVIFDTFAGFYATRTADVGGFAVYAMPATPPPVEPSLRVLSVGIAGYADGIYPVESLGRCELLPPDMQTFSAPQIPMQGPGDAASLLSKAGAVLVAGSSSLDDKARDALAKEFRPVGTHGAFTVYSRPFATGAAAANAKAVL
jgi:hypothetical protein